MRPRRPAALAAAPLLALLAACAAAAAEDTAPEPGGLHTPPLPDLPPGPTGAPREFSSSYAAAPPAPRHGWDLGTPPLSHVRGELFRAVPAMAGGASCFFIGYPIDTFYYGSQTGQWFHACAFSAYGGSHFLMLERAPTETCPEFVFPVTNPHTGDLFHIGPCAVFTISGSLASPSNPHDPAGTLFDVDDGVPGMAARARSWLEAGAGPRGPAPAAADPAPPAPPGAHDSPMWGTPAWPDHGGRGGGPGAARGAEPAWTSPWPHRYPIWGSYSLLHVYDHDYEVRKVAVFSNSSLSTVAEFLPLDEAVAVRMREFAYDGVTVAVVPDPGLMSPDPAAAHAVVNGTPVPMQTWLFPYAFGDDPVLIARFNVSDVAPQGGAPAPGGPRGVTLEVVFPGLVHDRGEYGAAGPLGLLRQAFRVLSG